MKHWTAAKLAHELGLYHAEYIYPEIIRMAPTVDLSDTIMNALLAEYSPSSYYFCGAYS